MSAGYAGFGGVNRVQIKGRWVIQPGRDHEETRMHVGAPRPEPSDVGMAKQGGRGEASQEERPDVTSCRDEVVARRGGRAGEVEGRWGFAHIHTGDARVRACAHVGAVSAAVGWPEGRAEAVPAARRPGESRASGHAAAERKQNIRSQAAGRRQCPQPGGGRAEAVPAAMGRPGGSKHPQPSGREEAVPAARRRPGGRSARSHEVAGRKQHPQPGGRTGTEYAENQPGGTAPAARRPGGKSARSEARRTRAEAKMIQWRTREESGCCRRPSRVRPNCASVARRKVGGSPVPAAGGPATGVG
jgi:hypothetical protein